MAKIKMRVRHIVRSEHPPSIVQGVAVSVVSDGLIAAHLFAEYPEMPKELELPEDDPRGTPFRAQSKRLVREIHTSVMMTPLAGRG